MELLTPGTGLIIWQLLAFLGLVWVLGRYAWRPILSSLRTRETFISDSIKRAEATKVAADELAVRRRSMEAEAQQRRDQLIGEAKSIAEELKARARTQARRESLRMQEETRQRLAQETEKARTQLRQEVVGLAVAVAEKILRKHLKADEKQSHLVARYLSELKKP